MGSKNIYTKGEGFDKFVVRVVWPSFYWNKHLPEEWGQEDVTIWGVSAPTLIEFRFNTDIEWELKIIALGFGVYILRQYSY